MTITICFFAWTNWDLACVVMKFPLPTRYSNLQVSTLKQPRRNPIWLQFLWNSTQVLSSRVCSMESLNPMLHIISWSIGSSISWILRRVFNLTYCNLQLKLIKTDRNRFKSKPQWIWKCASLVFPGTKSALAGWVGVKTWWAPVTLLEVRDRSFTLVLGFR